MPYAITKWNVQQYVEMGLRAWNDAFYENFIVIGSSYHAIREDHVIYKAVLASPLGALDLVDFLAEVGGY